MSLALHLVAASHDGINTDVPVKACGRQHRGVPGTPLDIKAPLTAGGQLVQHLERRAFIDIRGTTVEQFFFPTLCVCVVLNLHLCCVWVPAKDPVVLPAAQEQLGISQTPGDGQDTPVNKEQ